jgi:hypothetical protein
VGALKIEPTVQKSVAKQNDSIFKENQVQLK